MSQSDEVAERPAGSLNDQGGRWRVRGALDTARLSLRAHKREDLDDLLSFHSDPTVTRYIPWPVRDREATRLALESKLHQDSANEGEWIVLAVTLQNGGPVIGEVLLKRVNDDVAEMGYVLSKSYQRRGYAQEAVKALLNAAAGWGVSRVVARVDDRNVDSKSLLVKLGFASVSHEIINNTAVQTYELIIYGERLIP